LLAYARWMLDHEVPYMQVFDRLEYPTETWPAHDLRKSVVFFRAAQQSEGSLRRRFWEAAVFYRGESLAGLATFPTKGATRPLAILLQNLMQASLFGREAESMTPSPNMPYDFRTPQPFEPQKARVKKLLRSPRGLCIVLSRLTQLAGLASLLRLARLEL